MLYSYTYNLFNLPLNRSSSNPAKKSEGLHARGGLDNGFAERMEKY